MTEKDLEQMLALKEELGRNNAALVMYPHIARNAAQLRKKRRDRNAILLTAVLAIAFLAFSVGAVFLTAQGDNRLLMDILKLIPPGGAAITLLLAPLLAWQSDRDEAQAE